MQKKMIVVQPFHEYQAETKQERKKAKELRKLKKSRKGIWQS